MKTLKNTQTIILLTLVIVLMFGIQFTELLISKFQKSSELVEENNTDVGLDLIQYANN